MKKSNFFKKIKQLLTAVNQPTGAYITHAVLLCSLLVVYVIKEIEAFEIVAYTDLSIMQIVLKFVIFAVLLTGAAVYSIKGIISYKK